MGDNLKKKLMFVINEKYCVLIKYCWFFWVGNFMNISYLIILKFIRYIYVLKINIRIFKDR